jgi:hypothetical protein
VNLEFNRFIDQVGGIEKAMEFLNWSQSSVYKTRSGERSVSKKVMFKIIEKYPNIDGIKLMQGEQAA